MALGRFGLASSTSDYTTPIRLGRLLQLPVGLLLVTLLLALTGYAAPTADSGGGSQPEEVSYVGSQVGSEEAPKVDLSLNPGTPWARAGETVTFAIYAEGNTGASAVQLSLDHGRDLEIVEAKPGPYLGEKTIAMPMNIDAEKNQATFAWARIGKTPSSVPPGVLALVTVRAAPGFPWNTWIRPRR